MRLAGDQVTRLDVIPHDGHVVVAVSSGLLMPEAQRVQELMLDRPNAVAVGPDRQLLLPDVAVADRREAPAWQRGVEAGEEALLGFGETHCAILSHSGFCRGADSWVSVLTDGRWCYWSTENCMLMHIDLRHTPFSPKLVLSSLKP